MPNENDENEVDKALTGEALKLEITRQVNGAVSGLIKKGAFKELLSNTVAGAIKDAMPGLLEGLKQPAAEAPAANTGAAPSTPATGNDSLPPEVRARMAELERSQKTLADQLKKRDEEAAVLQAKTRETTERSRLADAMRKAGVPEDRLRGALALVYTEDKRVKTAEDGSIVFLKKGDLGIEEVELERGVEEWAKSDDGKAYLPPVAATGSGNVGAGRQATAAAGKAPTTVSLLEQLGSAMISGKPAP